MLGRLFRRNWVEARAFVRSAEPLHHDTTSAVVPYRATFEVHIEGEAAPATIAQKLTVGRGKPFGANLWVAVRVNPARDALEIDWDRTTDVQMASGDAASKMMAAMSRGITDPKQLQALLGATPADHDPNKPPR